MGLLLDNTFQVVISLDFLKGNVLCPLLLLSPFVLFISELPGLGKPALLRCELPHFLGPSRRFLLQPGLCFLRGCMSGPSGIPHSFMRSLPGFQLDAASQTGFRLPLPHAGRSCLLGPTRVCLICLSFHLFLYPTVSVLTTKPSLAVVFIYPMP